MYHEISLEDGYNSLIGNLRIVGMRPIKSRDEAFPAKFGYNDPVTFKHT